MAKGIQLCDLSRCLSRMGWGIEFCLCHFVSIRNDIWKAQRFCTIVSWLLWIIRRLCCKQFLHWKLSPTERAVRQKKSPQSIVSGRRHRRWRSSPWNIVFSPFSSTNRLPFTFTEVGRRIPREQTPQNSTHATTNCLRCWISQEESEKRLFLWGFHFLSGDGTYSRLQIEPLKENI